jgi:hypothetical protein
LKINVTLLKLTRNERSDEQFYNDNAPQKASRKRSGSAMSKSYTKGSAIVAAVLLSLCFSISAVAAIQSQGGDEDDFGPVVRAYLGYLRTEQEVVDDRVSRHEVSPTYYRRNSNRIRALRQMAIRIARQSRNDYLPELEAVTRDEFRLLFENPPLPQTLRVGDVIRGTFRFLGTERSSEVFYVFARLDPYEQAELREQHEAGKREVRESPQSIGPSPAAATRDRRVNPP